MSTVPTDLPPGSPDEIPAADHGQFRSQMGQISRHSAVFFTGTIFTAAAGYVFKVFLARFLGAEALGLYALGMTIIGFFGIFNALGIPHAAVRFVAVYTATRRLNDLRGFLVRSFGYLTLGNLVLAFVVIIAGPWIAVHFYRAPELGRYATYFALIMVGGALTTFFGQVLQGYKDVSRRTVVTNFVGTPLMMVITVVLVKMGFGLDGYLAAQVVSPMVVIALLIAVAWKLTPADARHLRRPLPPLEGQVLTFSAAAFGMSVLEFLLAQIDKIMIGFYINAREVGIYSVAMAIVAFVPVALQSVNQIFSPTIAELHARGQQILLGRLYQTLTKWILAFTLPLATVVVLFSRQLMQIFGSDFVHGWPVLVIGTLGQLINCGAGPVGYLLLMSGNQNRLLKVQITMTTLTVLLNLALVPKAGILGAAVAAAVTTAFSNVWYLREVHAALGLFPLNRSYLKLIVPWVVSALAVAAAEHSWAHGHTVSFIMGAMAVAYTLFLSGALLFGLDSDDRLVARAVWAKLSGNFQRVEVGF
jgi:O-antigen/teichoic acid export membrane protein